MPMTRRVLEMIALFAVPALMSAGFVRAEDTAAETPGAEVEAFLQVAAATAAGAAESGANAVPGKDGWIFFAPELRHLAAGPFWGNAVLRPSQNGGKAADPLPAIESFHKQLAERGIKLIVVPVPAKAAVWPDMISDAIAAGDDQALPRVDTYDARFYAVLGRAGVEVLDLAPVFLKQRTTEQGPVYCRTDTHWSGAGLVVAAEAVAKRIKAVEGYEAPAENPYEVQWDEVEITGDMVGMLPEGAAKPGPERLKLRFVSKPDEGAPEPDESSPVLLVGDSHTLVFHAGGDLHAKGAGLPDQLAYELGVPVDLLGTRGSGATTVRIDLYRRCQRDAGYLAGKKVVVWCFAARDFTESAQGWRVLPVSP